MQSILTFRFRTTMSDDELIERMESRLSIFREVEGLLQKYYCREAETGAFCGVYLFDTPEHATAYRAGKVISGIPEALQLDGEMRVEQIDLIMALRADQYVAQAGR
ncbi:MAG: hypothetical protein JWL76_921 [Thermoleophilia bacterium]|nr:hypothetical protein [Thermoleophilia bacterium]